MESLLSSLFNSGEEQPPNENSRVIPIHSKTNWDEHCTANKQDSNNLMLIDFTAKWCGPCRFVGPTFEAFSAQYTGMAFLKVDVDELPEVSKQWKVEAMPTFLLLKGGKEAGRVIGANKNELQRMIQQHLNVVACKSIAMSTPLVSMEIKNRISEDRRSALSSSWIRRLCPETHSHHSHSSNNFSHLNSRLPLCFLPKVPNPPLNEEEVAHSSELVPGFGPYQVRAASQVSPFFQYRRQLTTGILGNNQLRPAHEMVDESPSQLPVQNFGTWKGFASRDRVDDHSAATRNFYNSHTSNLSTAHLRCKPESCCSSSEPEEPFSYWNMGRAERSNFVSSVYPVRSSTPTPSRKRTANTYGFVSSKFTRFCSEGNEADGSRELLLSSSCFRN